MERSHGAIKRHRVSTIESALANIDVVSHLSTFLEAKDLCQFKATCKVLGSANGTAEVNGLSTVDESVKRLYELASDEEKALLPRHSGESWIELYHHLVNLRARLTFDQLVGRYIEYRGGDKSSVQGKKVYGAHMYSQAICGNHVMRAGKHWATFTSSSSFDCYQRVGVIRPLPGWAERGLRWFNPGAHDFLRDLQHGRTDRWKGDVHLFQFNMKFKFCFWSDWEGDVGTDRKGCQSYNEDCMSLGMLLDLGNGTLSLYQRGRRLGTLKEGLAGEYCWLAGFYSSGDLSIQRGYKVNIE